MGYSPEQGNVVPFLVLHKAFLDHMKEPENSKKKEIYLLVLETCRHVFFDFGENKRLSE
jgi:hypothetical protein